MLGLIAAWFGTAVQQGGRDIEVAGAVGTGIHVAVGIRPLVRGQHQAGFDRVGRERSGTSEASAPPLPLTTGAAIEVPERQKY